MKTNSVFRHIKALFLIGLILPSSVLRGDIIEEMAKSEAMKFAKDFSGLATTGAVDLKARTIIDECSKDLRQFTRVRPGDKIMLFDKIKQKETEVLSSQVAQKFGELTRKMDFAYDVLVEVQKPLGKEAEKIAVSRSLNAAGASHMTRYAEAVNRFVAAVKHHSSAYDALCAAVTNKIPGAAEKRAALLAERLTARFGSEVEATTAARLIVQRVAFKGAQNLIVASVATAAFLTSGPLMAMDEALAASTLGTKDDLKPVTLEDYLAVQRESIRLTRTRLELEAEVEGLLFNARQYLGIDNWKSRSRHSGAIEDIFKFYTLDPAALSENSAESIQKRIKDLNLEPVFGAFLKNPADTDVALVAIVGSIYQKREELNKFIDFCRTDPRVLAIPGFLDKHEYRMFGSTRRENTKPCAAAEGGRIAVGDSCANYTNFTNPLGYQEPGASTPPAQASSPSTGSSKSPVDAHLSSVPPSPPQEVIRSPTSQPNTQPASQPAIQPARQPVTQPTRQPASQPVRQPASQPSGQTSSPPGPRPTGSQSTTQGTSPPSNYPAYPGQHSR